MKIQFPEFDRVFLTLSCKWLSDSTIKYLTQTPDITKENQEKWFASIRDKDDYYIRGITVDDKPIGACGLKHITSEAGEYWGYIGERDFWGKGIGGRMMAFIEEYAKTLGLRQIYLQVLNDNERAVRLYAKNGYEAVSEEENMIKMVKQL